MGYIEIRDHDVAWALARTKKRWLVRFYNPEDSSDDLFFLFDTLQEALDSRDPKDEHMQSWRIDRAYRREFS